MHTKCKGGIGELAVAKNLMLQGFAVFTELGDLSRVDLIAIKGTTTVRLQVKYRAAKNNVVEVAGRKSGPNYSYEYSVDDVDVFAVYCPDVDDVAYVPILRVAGGKSVSLRLQYNKQLQTRDINWFKNHRSLERALRDYTHDTETGKAVGDEIVQTYNIPTHLNKDSRKTSRPRKTKISWPLDTELVNLCKSFPMTTVAAKLGVSDNAVRKRLKSRKLWDGLRNQE
jgi:hypothetical protein